MAVDQPGSAATEPCGMCDGTGSIVVHFRHGLQEQDCVACDGTGRLVMLAASADATDLDATREVEDAD